MKKKRNLWVIPTDKPSILQMDRDTNIVTILPEIMIRNSQDYIGANIYITSDEEIKEGDWYIIEFNGTKIIKCTSEQELMSIEGRNDCQKIIITTDKELIEDGLQAIDDEFLEWFIKNPSCVYVDIKKGFEDGTDYGYNFGTNPLKARV